MAFAWEFKKETLSWVVVAHAFNASTQEAETEDLCEFKVTLVNRMSSKTVKVT